MADFPLLYCPFTLDEDVVVGSPRVAGGPFVAATSAALIGNVKLVVAELSFRAESEEREACEGLLDIASQATRTVVNLAKSNPKLLAPLLAHDPGLPVLANLRTERTPETLELLKSLKVGSGLAKAPSSKSRQSPHHILTKYSQGLLFTLEMNARVILLRKQIEVNDVGSEKRKELERRLARLWRQYPTLLKDVDALPPWIEELDKLLEFAWPNVAKHWNAFWRIAKLALLDQHPRPEKVPELAALLPREGMTTKKGTISMTPAQRKARILERLGRAFRTYCAHNL